MVKDFYKQSVEDVCSHLGTDPDKGLSSEEAKKRLEKYGPNELAEKKKKTIWRMFFSQFTDFLIIILLVAAGVSILVGESVDAILIMIIVVLNATLSTIQESKAEKSLQLLKKMAAPMARVLRDGIVQTVPSREIVPGDIVILEAGNYVPADGRLIETVNFSVSEAALTGESQPVEKTTDLIDQENLPLGDRTNMVYSGTIVSRGRAKAVITSTGENTELGKIAKLLSEMEETQTPLQQNLEKLGKQIGMIILAICAVVFLVGIFEGEPALEMFLTAVSLAVAAVPEGLPAVVTIVLALGMYNMVKRHAVIRKLQAVEALGSVNVICSDKTGTLTKNEMNVVKYYLHPSIILDQEQIKSQKSEHIEKLFMGAILCNDSFITVKNGNRVTSGDPTEIALALAAMDYGFDKNELEKRIPRIHEIPFDSDRKMMTTVHEFEKKRLSFTKGAPDVVIKNCSKYMAPDGEIKVLSENDKNEIEQANMKMAQDGLRVLAIAFREIGDDYSELEKDLVFLGLMGMIDPPRPEVKDALERCRTAGINVIMITGDHKITAQTIAREIGILSEDDMVLTGHELIEMDVEDLVKVVDKVKVYARVSPTDKLKIVEALKKKGKVVAMTGDGVNDAPALKKADIGVAMGITGTDVSKDASEMVLTDDNFASIVAAVEEGRKIFDNIRKVVYYLLSCNISEVVTIFVSILLRLPLPLIPVQILWMNLVTDGLPALALGVEPAEPDVMKRSPRDPKEGIMSKEIMTNVFIGGTILSVLTLFVYSWALLEHDQIELLRTMVFFTLCTGQLLHSLNSKSIKLSLFKVGIKNNPRLLIAIAGSFALLLGVIYLPILQNVFGTTNLTGKQLVVSLIAAIMIIPLYELVKVIRYRKKE
ncbi:MULTISPECIES: calcium-transporting P-type ATPase, PMR1-type [Pseudothermotoga]|jgi:Ca2+-transporting ATPase|uniref:calcium-transporting P-type ATPase, PMR1-type n=1 Tax=Pseudothermotoga TaxID=1643951 RepID=UPI0004003BD6|nr:MULTISPECIES: calcium-transporting P-type ATPase, PMR1-type [Pseudothermotoga]